MITTIKSKENITQATFVDADHFLLRIKHFEQKYDMDSFQFIDKYERIIDKYERNDFTRNVDYTEWAFLCRNFWTELIELEQKGPPGLCSDKILQKPDSESGFFIERDICATIRNISRGLRMLSAAVDRLRKGTFAAPAYSPSAITPTGS